MTINVAQLMVSVTADTQMAEQGLMRVAKMLGPAAPLAVGAIGAAGVVAAIGVTATKMAGDFQSGMTSLVTGAGESQGNLKLVSDGILKMATDTGTSTKQLTDGLYMIESAGYHGQAGLDVLKSAAEGAKVGNADLGTVADATTTILKDFGDTGINANQAVNTLVTTVANGKTHMQDLAGAMSQILPTAKATGVGLKDTMGAMATMTGEGVDAANAATYLRQMMLALSAPTSTAKSALKSVGLSAEDLNTSLKDKGLPATLQMIEDHVGKKFPAGSTGYIEALKNISGGSKQMQGMLDLTGSHLADFKTNTETVGSALDKGKDKVTGWSQVQQDFNFKASQAKEKLETMGIALGQKLLPMAGQFMDFLTKQGLPALQNLASRLKDAADRVGDFVNFLQTHQTAMDAFKAILIAVGVVILASVVPAFIGWAIAAGAAAIGTIAATLPVLAIIAAIALLTFGIIELVRHWSQVVDWLGHVKDAFGDLLGVIGNFFGSVMGAAGTFFGNLFGAIGGFVGNALGAIGGFVGNALGALGNLKDQAIQKAEDLASGFINGLLSLPGKMVDLGKNLIGSLINGLASRAGALNDKLKSIPLLGGIIAGDENLASGLLSHLPHFASGGTMQQGGLAVVGENGPELVNLPAGAQVIPNPQVASVMSAGIGGSGGYGANGAATTQQTIILQVDGRKMASVVLQHAPTVLRNATGNRVLGAA